jgi:carbon-monoxide dehydrogenase medium subunit
MLDGRLVCSCLVLGCEVGSRLDRAAQDRLEAASRAACSPIDDKRGTVEFRIQVAGVLARRAALIALDRARTV